MVAHYDATNGNLRFARCHDAACAVRNGALATLDGSRDVGQRTSIAIGLDGVAVVAYDDATHEMVKIARPAILR